MEGKSTNGAPLPATWWGQFELEIGVAARWQIGPLQVVVQRLPSEWLVWYERETAEGAGDLSWHFARFDGDIDRYDRRVTRFVRQSTSATATVMPALADRPVVSRPFTPFTVPIGEKATLYISTPLWFTLSTGDPPQLLTEIPIQRPSDTWFGPSTMIGEACYASRTYGRLNLEHLDLNPYRALTQIRVTNTGMTPLFVERLNLPVPYLSLYAAAGGALWTEAVAMEQAEEHTLAELSVGEGPPDVAAGARLISPSRLVTRKNMLVRAFSVLKIQGL